MYTDEWATAQAATGPMPWQSGAAAAPVAPQAVAPQIVAPPVGAPQAALGGKAVLTPAPTAPAVPQPGAVGPIYQALNAAMNALQLTCGITSELRVLPEARGFAGLSELHGQVLTPMSYHLTTALGAARLIAAGHNRRPMWLLLLGCMMAAERYGRAMPEWMGRLQQSAGARFSGLMRAAQDWGARTNQLLQRALVTAQTVMGPGLWNELSREAAQV